MFLAANWEMLIKNFMYKEKQIIQFVMNSDSHISDPNY